VGPWVRHRGGDLDSELSNGDGCEKDGMNISKGEWGWVWLSWDGFDSVGMGGVK
jgi:hypothetical protein